MCFVCVNINNAHNKQQQQSSSTELELFEIHTGGAKVDAHTSTCAHRQRVHEWMGGQVPHTPPIGPCRLLRTVIIVRGVSMGISAFTCLDYFYKLDGLKGTICGIYLVKFCRGKFLCASIVRTKRTLFWGDSF